MRARWRRRRGWPVPSSRGALPSPAPFSALSLALPGARQLSRPRCPSPAPAPPPSVTMAHRGPPRAPKGPGTAARAPNPGAPLPPRWRPLPLPLLVLVLLVLAACGAAGRSPEPGLLGPRARVLRVARSPHSGRAEPGGGEDRRARGTEPGTPGLGPDPAPGPAEDGAPGAGRGRWARAAPAAGAASRAQVSLISTSFVLKGDATHNQAMVHWAGEDSSVSDPAPHLGPPGAAPPGL